jgi:hypothetical protein
LVFQPSQVSYFLVDLVAPMPHSAIIDTALRRSALFIPNPFAALFTFEEANCFSALRIEELMAQLQCGGARWAVQKPISLLCFLSLVHAISRVISQASPWSRQSKRTSPPS